MTARSELVRFEHVVCSYGAAPVIEDVSFVIGAEEFVGIVGPSGSGKTTVLRAMLGVIEPSFGRVVRESGATLGYVPQVGIVDWNFPVTVHEVVSMAIERRRWRGLQPSDRARVDDVLERLGIGGLGQRRIRALSGGQQQRVFVARALVHEPDVLVLDEPAGGVDLAARHELLHLLADLHHDGTSIVLTTHDINGLAAHLPRLICFNRTVVADGPPEQVLHPYVLERTFGASMEVLRHGGMPVVLEQRSHGLHERLRRQVGMTGFDPFAPFAYEFFQRGLLVATLAGGLCGLIGVYVVLRSMSYIGHGLSHAVFGGAAVSAVLGWSYFVGAGAWGVLAGLLIARVTGRRVIGADAAIGVVTTASFAIGLVVQARSGAVNQSLDAVLFGDVVGVFQRDVVAVVAVGAVVVAFVAAFQRELTFATFDPEVAAVSGIRVSVIDAVLLIAVAATVIVSVRVIGALLVSAMLVLPAATARLMTDSISRMLRWSPAIGAASGLVGMYISWYADVPSGAAITLVGTSLFAVAYLASDVNRRRALARLDQHGTLA